ncbi:unnamed protein product [Cylicostephanus goldi]|uniref:Uncharacterized protein n=1 Tax=Cylicostephanus goldi TaxID=71465 RepID=A0A3P6R1U0_CYLGO|nr:unnamed protein product [Cylicostephanus goldi]
MTEKIFRINSDEVVEVAPDSAVIPAEPLSAILEPAPSAYVEQEPVAVLSADYIKHANIPVVPTTVVVAPPPPPPPPPAPVVIMKKIHHLRPRAEVRNVARHYVKESGRTSASAMVLTSPDVIEEVPLILQYAAPPPPPPAYTAAPPTQAYVAPVPSSTYVARTPMHAAVAVVANAPAVICEPVIMPVHHHIDTEVHDAARAYGREAHTSATAMLSGDDLDFDDIYPVHDDYLDDVLDFKKPFETLFKDLHFPAFRRARVVLCKTTLKTTA